MNRYSFAAALSLTLGLLAISDAAQAATFCVTTGAELQQALDVAAVNKQDDYIQVTQGAYTSATGGFLYREAKSDYGKKLKIVGGWTGSRGEPCKEYVLDPRLTMIDGLQRNRGMDLEVGLDSSVEIWLLTFLQGRADDYLCGGGLRIATEDSGRADSTHSASARVYLSWFLLNRTEIGGGLCVASSREIHVVNSIFVGNHAHLVGGGMSLQNGNPMDGKSWAKLYVISNTVLNNTTESYDAGGVAVLHADEVVMTNNLAWNNSNHDIQLGYMYSPSDTLDAALLHNDFWSRSYNSQVSLKEVGNIKVAPIFEPGMFSYTPVAGSALVDSGFPPDGKSAPWDFYGNARVVNKQIDIGAVEVP